MGITIVSTHEYISGSLLNLYDLKQYIQENSPDVESTFIYTEGKVPYWAFMKENIRGLYALKNLKNIKTFHMFEDDVVIIDIRGLIELFYIGMPIVCKKLVVVDSVELSYHLNEKYDAGQWFGFRADYSIPFTQYLENIKYDECVFLMPPSNIDNFSMKYKIPCLTFFKRINPKVLLTQETSNNGKLFVRRDTPGGEFDFLQENFDIISYENEMDMFKYRGLIYHRRNRIGRHEQFGRVVFELIMLDKQVYFLRPPFQVADGLSDYLRYYDIKFKGKKVVTKPEELIEKMNRKYEVEPWT